MKKVKLLCLITAVILSFTMLLTSCGGGNSGGGASSGGETASSESSGGTSSSSESSSSSENASSSDSSSGDASTETAETTEQAAPAIRPAAFTDLDPIFPLDEKVTFKCFNNYFSDVRGPTGEMWMFTRYEELTNVHIEWEDVPNANVAERKNLIMAANELPDFFFQSTGFSLDEIAKYGSGGQFIRLNELIDANGPHLRRVMEEWPVVRQAMTMPDGSIYSFPYIQPHQYDASLRYYVNFVWLDRLGLEVPKTTDEMTEVMRQFKLQDANGNGDPDDEYTWLMPSTFGGWTLEAQLLGSFGGGNRGMQAINMGIDQAPDGSVRFIPTSDPIRDVWEYMAGWYREGLVGDEYFSGIDYAQWVALADEDRVGAQSFVHSHYSGMERENDFVGFTVLKGPRGDAIMTWCDPPVRGVNSMMITSTCKNTDILVKWADFFYCDQGTIFGYLGEEGVTFNYNSSGDPVYIDEIVNSDQGAQIASYQWVNNVYGGYYPFLDIDVPRRLKATGESMLDYFKTEEDLAQFTPAHGYWATFAGTADEADDLAILWTDLNGYKEEMRPKFITGELNLTSDWDAYVARMEQMGSGKYEQIRQQQWDRLK